MKDLIEIGKITRTHGLKGEVRVNSYLESDLPLRNLKKLYIGSEDDSKPFRITRLKIQHKSILLQLEGVEDADAADQLVGCAIFIHSDNLEKLSEGEYYWKDLIGLEVSTEEGESLGFIQSIFPTGSNDVYVCQSKEREILLPAIPEVIRDIDLKKGRVVVRLLEGL